MSPSRPEKEVLVLDLLQRAGHLTIEQAAADLPELSWNELFHTVDRLSRQGAILLQRRGFDYELSAAGSCDRRLAPI